MPSETTPDSKPKPLLDETLDDHADCMQIVAEVERRMKEHPDIAWVDRLREQLPKLVDTLRCHFSDEQQGSLYRELPVHHPRLADRLAKLEAEHGEILQAAEETIRHAEGLRDPETHDLRRFRAQVHLLLAKIRRHEAEENEIVVSAYWDSIGTGD